MIKQYLTNLIANVFKTHRNMTADELLYSNRIAIKKDNNANMLKAHIQDATAK